MRFPWDLRTWITRTVFAAATLNVAGCVFVSTATAAQQPRNPEATLVLVAPTSACVEARLDDRTTARGRYVAAGNIAELATVEGAGHFFGFSYPPGQRQMREAIANALRGWGWTTP